LVARAFRLREIAIGWRNYPKAILQGRNVLERILTMLAAALINSDSGVVSGLALWAMVMRVSTTGSSSSRARVRQSEFLTVLAMRKEANLKRPKKSKPTSAAEAKPYEPTAIEVETVEAYVAAKVKRGHHADDLQLLLFDVGGRLVVGDTTLGSASAAGSIFGWDAFGEAVSSSAFSCGEPHEF
jgi:hypothetical protein